MEDGQNRSMVLERRCSSISRTTSKPEHSRIHLPEDLISNKLDDCGNEFLGAPFREEEIKERYLGM